MAKAILPLPFYFKRPAVIVLDMDLLLITPNPMGCGCQ
jgi:hypothetical protein